MATPNKHPEIELAAAPQTTPNGPRGTATPTPQTFPDAGDAEYSTIVENPSSQISSLQNSAFTLANYYFVSQAVVFTALSSNSSLVCRDVWFPLFMSLLPGAFNLFAFFRIGQEYIETIILQKKYKILRRDLQFRRLGLTRTHILDDGYTNHMEREKVRLTRILYICMCAVGFLAAVTAVGSLWMLCGESIIVKHNAKRA